MSKIGIVTVLYNSEPVLEEFFQTLGEQTEKDFTLYLVDNASKDTSLELSRRLAATADFPCVFFAEKENWGVAKGNNIGIEAALADGCEYVLLSNNDIVLRPDTIENLLRGMKEMDADMAVPKIYYHDSGLIWCAGGRYRWLMGDTQHIGEKEEDNGQYDSPCFTEYSPTCFMLIKSDIFRKIGMMDEKYFVYFDDTDFVYRAVKKNGKKLAYIPSSTLRHKVSTSTGQGSEFSHYMNARNGMYFARKNFIFPHKQITVLARLLYTLIRAKQKFTKENYLTRKRGTADGLKY